MAIVALFSRKDNNAPWGLRSTLDSGELGEMITASRRKIVKWHDSLRDNAQYDIRVYDGYRSYDGIPYAATRPIPGDL